MCVSQIAGVMSVPAGNVKPFTRSSLFTVRLPGATNPQFLNVQLVSGRYFETLQAAVTAAFVLVNGDGEVDTAHRLLVGAIENSREASDMALEHALNTLTIVCFFVKANGLGFFADDWRLAQRGGSVGDYFQPYNDSLSVVPIAIYRAPHTASTRPIPSPNRSR